MFVPFELTAIGSNYQIYQMCLVRLEMSINDQFFFWLQSKNVAKKRYIVKEKRAQLEQLRASNAQLKQQHDERYRSMLKHFSVEQLNHLLSYSMDELKAMPVDVSSPTGESFEPYVNLNLQTIDEFCIEVTK